MSESTQELIKALVTKIHNKESAIKELTKANEIQGIRQKEIKRRYKNTVLLLSTLLSLSVIVNILLLFK